MRMATIKKSETRWLLGTIWRNGNTYALLVGMQIGAATVENYIQTSQKTKNRSSKQPSNSTSGYFPTKTKPLIGEDTCTPPFVAALFTTPKIWKQPRFPPIDDWIKNCHT